jgi:hypothetical protein
MVRCVQLEAQLRTALAAQLSTGPTAADIGALAAAPGPCGAGAAGGGAGSGDGGAVEWQHHQHHQQYPHEHEQQRVQPLVLLPNHLDGAALGSAGKGERMLTHREEGGPDPAGGFGSQVPL